MTGVDLLPSVQEFAVNVDNFPPLNVSLSLLADPQRLREVADVPGPVTPLPAPTFDDAVAVDGTEAPEPSDVVLGDVAVDYAALDALDAVPVSEVVSADDVAVSDAAESVVEGEAVPEAEDVMPSGPFDSVFVEDELSPDSEIHEHAPVVDLPVEATDVPVVEPVAAPAPVAAPTAPPVPAAPTVAPADAAPVWHAEQPVAYRQEPVFTPPPMSEMTQDAVDPLVALDMSEDSGVRDEEEDQPEKVIDPNIAAVVFPKSQPDVTVDVPVSGFDPSRYLNFDTAEVTETDLAEGGLNDETGRDFGVATPRSRPSSNPEALKVLRELNAFKDR